LTSISAIAFATAIRSPFVQIAPGESLDALTGGVVWLLTDDETLTLLGTVAAIWGDNRMLGGIAFIFSLVMPTIKLLLLGYCSYLSVRGRKQITYYRRWAERIGPWSMLEIFLVALTLLITKSLPLGTVIHLLPGFYLFFGSIILSLIAAGRLAH
jgi:uncharacterized paraquat-inducible protein A